MGRPERDRGKFLHVWRRLQQREVQGRTPRNGRACQESCPGTVGFTAQQPRGGVADRMGPELSISGPLLCPLTFRVSEKATTRARGRHCRLNRRGGAGLSLPAVRRGLSSASRRLPRTRHVGSPSADRHADARPVRGARPRPAAALRSTGRRGNPERALRGHGRGGTPALPGGPGRVQRPRRGLLARGRGAGLGVTRASGNRSPRQVGEQRQPFSPIPCLTCCYGGYNTWHNLRER